MTAIPDQSATPAEEISAALQRIESSPEFIASPRLCRFLRYVVEQALLGDAERLKEYSIALFVFDRDAAFDQRNDTIVRVQARRLR